MDSTTHQAELPGAILIVRGVRLFLVRSGRARSGSTWWARIKSAFFSNTCIERRMKAIILTCLVVISLSGCAAKMQVDKMQAISRLSDLCDQGNVDACVAVSRTDRF